MKKISIIGSASGWGAQNHQTESGPEALQTLKFEEILQECGINAHWKTIIRPSKISKDRTIEDPKEAIDLVNEQNCQVANSVKQALRENEFPVIIGGDHSIAVGNWGALTTETDSVENFGLIWIDAHMDAHTLETSPSNAYHGMPVAALMGYGENSLVNVISKGPKIKPENLVLLGVRSYETGEANLLDKLGVRIIKMEEIHEKGFKPLFKEALTIVKSGTNGFGMSIDLDGFDPQFAPGVGSPVVNGLIPSEVLPSFKLLSGDETFKGLEITEFNPARDVENKTAKLVKDILLSIFSRS